MESIRGSPDLVEPQNRVQPSNGSGIIDVEPKDRSGLERDFQSWIFKSHLNSLVIASPKRPNPAYLIRHPFKGIMNYFKGKADGETRRTPDIEEAVQSTLQISIAGMQRMRLRKLQSKLLIDATNMYFGRGEPHDWEASLQQFIQACRDYEYMRKASLEFHDPFTATSDDPLVKWMMMKVWYENENNWPEYGTIKRRLWWQSLKTIQTQPEPIGGVRKSVDPPPMIDPHQASHQMTQFVNLLKRILIAAGGGLFLIAPMWIMVLHNTRWTALASTSAFVAMFGTVMAFWNRDPKDIVSSTAAYAAVLVIFVGATISTTSTGG